MCLKREVMPQVDLEDLPGLFAHLNTLGITIAEREFPVSWPKIRQCMEDTPPSSFSNPLLLRKPLLVALSLDVLDGNRRLMGYRAQQVSSVRCFQLSQEFNPAMKAVLSYPRAYRYVDGPQPERV